MSNSQNTGVASKRAYVVAIAVILFFWQVAAWFLPDFLMPDVHVALQRLWEELNSSEFYEGLGNSMSRLGIGYGAALFFGIVLGIWTLKLVLYFVLFLWLRTQDWLAPAVFAWTMLAAVLGSLVLDAVALSIGPAVPGALTTIGATFESTLDTALDAPVAALLALLDGTLGFLFDEDTGVLSILVNAQNDPTDVGAGPEPTDWAGFPVADPPASTGRYDVDALRITVLGVLDPLEVTLDLARSSVGSNVLG